MIVLCIQRTWDQHGTREPNDFLDNEDCGTVWTNTGGFNDAGTWNDERCNALYNYICKRMYTQKRFCNITVVLVVV